MRCPRKLRAPVACLLLFCAALPARGAVLVTGDSRDASFDVNGTLIQFQTASALGASARSVDPGARTVVYVFELPAPDTGVTRVSSATFRFTVVPTPSGRIALDPPSYGIDLYALPGRSKPDVFNDNNPLGSDNYFGPSDPDSLKAAGRASDVLIRKSILGPGAFPLGERATTYDSSAAFVGYLNDQYAATAPGEKRYIFLRLNPDRVLGAEATGGYVAMAEATSGQPTLTLTFVPEPSVALAAGAIAFAATTCRRRPRSQV